MGKTVGAIAGGFAQDEAIKSGVNKGRAGYGAAVESLSAGKKEALGYLQPYMGIGEEAISPLSQLLLGKSYDPETGDFTEVSPEERMSAFTASPDYQFRLDQGQKQLEASQAAKGGLLSGRAMIEAQQFGQNTASSEYGDYLQRLMGLVGTGQASAGQGANIAGNVASQIGQAQIGSGNLAMQGRIARGQNQADVFGVAGSQFDQMFNPQQAAGMSGGAGASAAGAGGGAGGMAGLMTMFSDKTLKENIQETGKSESGIPIYHFEYKNKKHGEGRFEGVMAQDLLELKPEAVKEKDGFLTVDYSKIDVDFRRLDVNTNS